MGLVTVPAASGYSPTYIKLSSGSKAYATATTSLTAGYYSVTQSSASSVLVAGGSVVFGAGGVINLTSGISSFKVGAPGTFTSTTFNAPNANAFDVLYARTAGIWLAAGSSGWLSTSTDGITWTSRNSNFGTTTINGLGYGGDSSSPPSEKYVAVGNGGTVRSSTDGVTWTSRTSGTANSIENVIFGYGGSASNGQYMFVGGGPIVRYSSDASTWTTATTTLTTQANDAAYGNDTWVVTGTGQISTSTNLTTWSTRTNAFTNSGANISAIGFGNGLFVAGNTAAEITTSTDGITWTKRTNSSHMSGTIETIRYLSDYALWVACSQSTTPSYSGDGITWFGSSSLGPGSTVGRYVSGSPTRVVYNGGGNYGVQSTSPFGDLTSDNSATIFAVGSPITAA